MTSLEQLELTSSEPSSAELKTASDEYLIKLEATAPGVFHLICASPRYFERPKSRASQANAEPFVMREEVIGEMQTSEQPDGWRFAQDNCSITINRQDGSFELFAGEQCVLSSEQPGLLHADGVWQLSLKLDEQAAIYGLGMTTAAWNRRGERIVSDDPESDHQSLAWSTSGWGLFSNCPSRCIHQVGIDEAPDQYSILSYAKALDIYFFVGAPEQIFNQFTSLTGRPGQPNLAATGTVLKQLHDQSDEDFLNMARQLREQGVSLDTLQFSAPAMLRFQQDRMNLEWNLDRFNEPLKNFFESLKEEGWHPSVTTFPGILVDTPLFEELEDRGWLLIDESGDAFRFEGCPQSGGKPFGLLDLTYNSALQFWTEAHEQLLDQGQSISINFSDIKFPDGVEGRHGDQAPRLRNLYPLLLEQSLFNALSAHSTPPEAVVMRDFFTSVSQRVPWLQLSMKSHSWQALNDLYREALSLQHGAMTCVTHEIGNVDADELMSPDLYLRLLAYSVFTGNFVFHARNELLPTHYDEQVRETAEQWLSLRYRLIPYVLGIIEDSARTGLPIQRSMQLAFPADEQARQFEGQFMFGPALLIAPIMDDSNEKILYLPEGQTWWDLNTSEQYEGGQVLRYCCGIDRIPAFGCDGHMLSIGQDIKHLGEFNSARLLKEIWMFGRPEHNPTVLRNRIRVMQMQGSSYIKGLEGLRIVASEGLEVKRRGAEVRISPEK